MSFLARDITAEPPTEMRQYIPDIIDDECRALEMPIDSDDVFGLR